MTDGAPVEAEGEEEPTRFSRRQAIARIGGGGAVILGAGIVGGAIGGQAATANEAESGGSGLEHESVHDTEGVASGDAPIGDNAGPYGGIFAPPEWMNGTELDAATWAPPAPGGTGGAVRDVEMTVVEESIEIANGFTYEAWTYNGTAPGPTLRATEGDLLRIRFRNATNHDHNLHFHGRHSPTHDGWEPVPPGGETIYEIEAGPAGVHPYHCHTMPIDRHIAKGLYGTLIVDPKGGRPDAHELVLLQSGWDPDEVGRNEIYTWNGIAGFYEKFPIKVPTGDPVRVYLTNMIEFDPISSFHLHAETFKVWPSGIGDAPAFETDNLTMGQTDRAMIEFSLGERGRYMFHPHQHSIAHRGTMGWFAAI